jgi:hypothetical protein
MDPLTNQWDQTYVNVKSKFKDKEEVKDSFLTPGDMSSERDHTAKLKKKKSKTNRDENNLS